MTIHVTFWNEHRHEKTDEAVRRVYPEGLHAPIVQSLRENGMNAPQL
jgi:trehalose utilization protein